MPRIEFSNNDFYNFDVYGEMPDISFIVGTSNHGALLFYEGKCTQIIKAPVVYGITKYEDNWWIYIRAKKSGRIVSFDIRHCGGFNFKTRIKGLDGGIHQIDFIDTDLFVTDTYSNRILVYKNAAYKNKDMLAGECSKKIYPAGKLNDKVWRREQKNYAHFNSIYKHEDKIYILAHNDTHNTGKKSEVYELSKNFTVVDKLNIDASNAHNYYIDKDGYLTCDSLNNRILKNGKEVFKCNTFVRGLSISEDYIIVGGSGIEFDRGIRKHKHSHIYILDKNFDTVARVRIPRCQIMEIRRVDKDEYGLSNTCLK